MGSESDNAQTTAQPSRDWRHPSVRAIRTSDPVAWITDQARRLVFRAVEAGWSGPPFDPMALADLLRIEVRPTQDVLDARIVPSQGGIRIEFNPNRPPGRVRYSIAHEIGHTLFPDHAVVARHRLSAGQGEAAESELEMLCNLAAAEILMPIGSFPEAASTDLAIDAALELRARFDLSMEAVLLRLGRLAKISVGVFAAAPRGRTAADGYRLDYLVAPRDLALSMRRGDALPKGSVVSECTAVGFTAKGLERWRRTAIPTRVECVGIPPYRGDTLPRVAGLVRDVASTGTPRPSIRELVGDATEPRGSGPRIVAHVVNDATPRWGGGFALEVRRKWPVIQADFQEWARQQGRLQLGSVHTADIDSEMWVTSMVAQHGYGPSAKPRIRYEALARCLSQLADIAVARHASVHAPRIGAGQAGGNWAVIEEMIDEALVRRGVDVTVYDLPGAPLPVRETPGAMQMAIDLPSQ